MSNIRKVYGKDFGINVLLTQEGTIENLANLIDKQDNKKTNFKYLIKINSAEVGEPVFFVHPIGGSSLCYHQLATQLIVYDSFFSFLRRPKDAGKRTSLRTKRGPFSIYLDSNEIELSENFLPDSRISLPALHYGDVFFTSDKHQAKLIEILYPESKGKINLVSS